LRVRPTLNTLVRDLTAAGGALPWLARGAR
jgi:hypothetical protein